MLAQPSFACLNSSTHAERSTSLVSLLLNKKITVNLLYFLYKVEYSLLDILPLPYAVLFNYREIIVKLFRFI